MLDLTRQAMAGPSEAALAEALVRLSAALVGADQARLALVRDGELVTVAALGEGGQPPGSRCPIGFGVPGWVAATGRPVEIADARQDRRYLAERRPRARSVVAVPLQSNASVMGVLTLEARRTGAFARGTARALAPLAEAAAVFLSHLELDRALGAALQDAESITSDGLAETLHALKAPLHAGAGFVDIVADEHAGPLNAQQKDFLDDARAEFARVKQTLARLLELGASAARSSSELAPVHPADLVAETARRFRGQALRQQVSLQPRTDPMSAPVVGHRGALLQVLADLVQNALRVAPAGSAIDIEATASAPGWTSFAVADRGPGVPPGNAEQLFRRFEQGDSGAGARRVGDVGLGLWLSTRIVQQHHGRIWAENRSGGGSRFCFSLPSAPGDGWPEPAPHTTPTVTPTVTRRAASVSAVSQS